MSDSLIRQVLLRCFMHRKDTQVLYQDFWQHCLWRTLSLILLLSHCFQFIFIYYVSTSRLGKGAHCIEIAYFT